MAKTTVIENRDEKTEKRHSILYKIFFILKYGFALVLTILAARHTSMWYLFPALAELVVIFAFSNQLLGLKHKWIGHVVNAILLLLYNGQMMVLLYGNSYITWIILSNVSSLEDLSGNASLYISSGIALFILSFLPVGKVRFPDSSVMAAALAVELAFTMLYGAFFSPLFDYYAIKQDIIEANSRAERMENMPVNEETFRNYGLARYYGRDDKKGKNVVLILTEGLSQDVVEDERNVTPNILSYEQKSLHFDNYFNHTFATYMAIMGQLYSGFQMENTAPNCLTSIMQLFRENGYYTSFINTEPNNDKFTEYLMQMDFDEVIGEPGGTYQGSVNSLSDQEAYETLCHTMEEQDIGGIPFFTVIYTFGTHMSLDSTDELYGDGQNSVLNRFYNLDYQFGKFMEKFENSPLAEDTVIVFTADHTTYIDNDYQTAFPDVCDRPTDVGQIPLFFYYPGIEPQVIDVEGRNSLDLAPTICDYVGVNGVQDFLGVSLFSPNENNNEYDTFFYDGVVHLSTKGGEIRELTESEEEAFKQRLQEYFVLARSEK